MWKKVTPRRGSGLNGREPRKTFAVMRTRTNGVASLVIPGWAHNGETRCDIYNDGTRLAFAMGIRGQYAVIETGPNSKARKVTIPAQFAENVPYGTTDVSYTTDGDMIVVDLAQLKFRTAAE